VRRWRNGRTRYDRRWRQLGTTNGDGHWGNRLGPVPLSTGGELVIVMVSRRDEDTSDQGTAEGGTEQTHGRLTNQRSLLDRPGLTTLAWPLHSSTGEETTV
jgi:hypothetical protein